MKKPRRPRCYFCWHNYARYEPASFVAAQSSDQGKTVTWVKICNAHRDGWNSDGDWKAPIYLLGKVEF